jgi:hypothetical protein
LAPSIDIEDVIGDFIFIELAKFLTGVCDFTTPELGFSDFSSEL